MINIYHNNMPTPGNIAVYSDDMDSLQICLTLVEFSFNTMLKRTSYCMSESKDRPDKCCPNQLFFATQTATKHMDVHLPARGS